MNIKLQVERLYKDLTNYCHGGVKNPQCKSLELLENTTAITEYFSRIATKCCLGGIQIRKSN